MTMAAAPTGIEGIQGIALRLAAPEDLAAILDLRIAFERIQRNFDVEAEAGRRAQLASLLLPDIQSGALCCLIALASVRGEPVAVAQAALRMPRPASRGASRSKRAAEILNVYTDPAFRRRGIARALVQALVARARELGLGRVALQPTADSMPLYESLGFRGSSGRMSLSLRSRASEMP